MDKFYIITNREKDENLEMTRYIKNAIEKRGGVCRVSGSHLSKPGNGYYYTNPADIDKDTQAILVLGGDGTVIQAAHDVVDCNIPMLGFNLGTLGYLAEVEKDRVQEALDSLFADEYETEERMMLYGCCPSRPDYAGETALNDIVISRAGALRVVEYQIYVNDKYLTSYQADGIIVATPTGSTGYSMSAGGPIVAPDAQAILLTPICAHTLNRTSIVLDSKDRIGIMVEGSDKRKETEALASFDAGNAIELRARDRIEIRRSDKQIKLLRIKHDSFLQVLGRKMRG